MGTLHVLEDRIGQRARRRPAGAAGSSSELTSAATSRRPSRARRNQARRAPPCSRTRSRSVRNSCSRIITPEMVCDALTTERRSSCSGCRATVVDGAGRPGLDELWIPPLEIAHLAVGAPAEIAVAGLAQVGVGDQLEAPTPGRSAPPSRRRSPRCGRNLRRARIGSRPRTGVPHLLDHRGAARSRRRRARPGSRSSRGSFAPRPAVAGGARRAPANVRGAASTGAASWAAACASAA